MKAIWTILLALSLLPPLAALPEYGSADFDKLLATEMAMVQQVSSTLPKRYWEKFQPGLVQPLPVKRACQDYAWRLYCHLTSNRQRLANVDPIAALKELLRQQPLEKSLGRLSSAVIKLNQKRSSQSCFFMTPCLSCFYNYHPQCFELGIMMGCLARLAGCREATVATVAYPNSLATHVVTMVNLSPQTRYKSWYILDINFPGKINKLSDRLGYSFQGYTHGKIYPKMLLYLKEPELPVYRWVDSLVNLHGGNKILPLPPQLEKTEIYLQYLEKFSNRLLLTFSNTPRRYPEFYQHLRPFMAASYRACSKYYPQQETNFYFLYHKASSWLVEFLYHHTRPRDKYTKTQWQRAYQQAVHHYLNSIRQGPTTAAVFRLDFLLHMMGKTKQALDYLGKWQKNNLWVQTRLLMVTNLIHTARPDQAAQWYRAIELTLPQDVVHTVPSPEDIEYIQKTLDLVRRKLDVNPISIKTLRIGGKKLTIKLKKYKKNVAIKDGFWYIDK